MKPYNNQTSPYNNQINPYNNQNEPIQQPNKPMHYQHLVDLAQTEPPHLRQKAQVTNALKAALSMTTLTSRRKMSAPKNDGCRHPRYKGDMGVSINGGHSQSSSILTGFSHTNHPFRGTQIYGNLMQDGWIRMKNMINTS